MSSTISAMTDGNPPVATDIVPLVRPGTPNTNVRVTLAQVKTLMSASPTLVTPALGTPTAGVLSSCTGYALSALTGAGTGVLTFLATPSSANLAAALTDETGSGAAVFATSPTLVTPILGVAAASSLVINGASLSTYKLAVTGDAFFSGAVSVGAGSSFGASTFGGSLTLNGVTNWGGWWSANQNAAGGVFFGSGHNLLWASTTTNAAAGAGDTNISRIAAGVVGAGTGAAGSTAGTFYGTLKVANAYVATPQVCSGYVTLQDNTGTTYKVLVAA